MTDPWVSYDKGGNLYFLGQQIDSAALGLSAVSVSTWNGSAWTTPKILIEDVGTRGVFNDKISITGDPTRAGYAYATWLRWDVPNGGRQDDNADFHSFAWRGLPMISRTTDGGNTWSEAEPMRRSNLYMQGGQIAVAPDGTLYNVGAVLFTGAGFNDNGVYMGVMRSNDAGRTWSAPVNLAPIRRRNSSCLTTTSRFALATTSRTSPSTPRTATSTSSGRMDLEALNQIVMAKSTDGGRHWTGPTMVSNGGMIAQAYNHSVEVTDEEPSL